MLLSQFAFSKVSFAQTDCTYKGATCCGGPNPITGTAEYTCDDRIYPGLICDSTTDPNFPKCYVPAPPSPNTCTSPGSACCKDKDPHYCTGTTLVCGTSDTCATCGVTNGPCCAGDKCGAGTYCTGGTCKLNSTDINCDAEGKSCCRAGDSAATTFCKNGFVCADRTNCCDPNKVGSACYGNRCGSVSGPCCFERGSPYCNNNLQCVAGACAAPTPIDTSCGYMNKVCCPGIEVGQPCYDGLVCLANLHCGDGNAPSVVTPTYTPYNSHTIKDLSQLLGPIVKILFYVGLTLGGIFIVYAGYLLMTSEGDPQKVKEGQEHLTSAILGTIFILLSLYILKVIISMVTGSGPNF